MKMLILRKNDLNPSWFEIIWLPIKIIELSKNLFNLILYIV